MTGQQLKRGRRHCGLTRAQVAAVVPGWNWSDVMDVEAGHRAVKPWQALLIGRLFVETVVRGAVEEMMQVKTIDPRCEYDEVQINFGFRSGEAGPA